MALANAFLHFFKILFLSPSFDILIFVKRKDEQGFKWRVPLSGSTFFDSLAELCLLVRRTMFLSSQTRKVTRCAAKRNSIGSKPAALHTPGIKTVALRLHWKQACGPAHTWHQNSDSVSSPGKVCQCQVAREASVTSPLQCSANLRYQVLSTSMLPLPAQRAVMVARWYDPRLEMDRTTELP